MYNIVGFRRNGGEEIYTIGVAFFKYRFFKKVPNGSNKFFGKKTKTALLEVYLEYPLILLVSRKIVKILCAKKFPLYNSINFA